MNHRTEKEYVSETGTRGMGMLYITVEIFGRQGIRGEFREYETKALAIFRKHGGEVLVAYAPKRNGSPTETPDEIQILKIAGQPEFERFLNDPERAKLAAEREAVIRRMEAYLSEEIIGY